MRRALAMLALSLSAFGCDDASIVSETSADSAAATALDGGFDASTDASDGGFVEEVDAAPDSRDASALPYARGVVSFEPGTNAGFGENRYPQIVLGPPVGKGNRAGSLDVLSLGVGGEIVLDFGARTIVDGVGPDFVVFENPFWAGDSQASVYAELGEVSVSNDLTTWLTFPCSLQPTQPGVYPGCAGRTPTQVYDPFAVSLLDPALTGGDAFDLATLPTASARYVRVRDLSASGRGSSGFDLDAVGIIHAE